MAKSLVSDPSAVSVQKEVEGERSRVIELRVAAGDIGKVIGKQDASRKGPTYLCSVLLLQKKGEDTALKSLTNETKHEKPSSEQKTMNKSKDLVIGIIRGTHGLSGTMKIESTSGEIDHFFSLKEVRVKGKP